MRIIPLVAIVLCGCYVNVPIATTPDPGQRVHVSLTDQGSVDLARYLGRNIGSVDGRLLDGNDSTLTLSVEQVTDRSGQEAYWKGETVKLPRQTVATVQGRKLSFWRSGLIGGALLGALAIVVGSEIGGSSGGRGTPPPPPPK
ncbi:MAG TPA: hypothetical protein VFK04_10950 [Gemmatimonadaceae bacterium]|jgi:hypothetical protein|nr:hypothetical protein [Gemmatimonadaceae bacterium]